MAVTLTNIPKSVGVGQVFPGNPIGLLLTLTYTNAEDSVFNTTTKNTAPVYTLSRKTSFTDAFGLSLAGNTATIPAGSSMGLLMALTYGEDQTYSIAGENFTLLIDAEDTLVIQPADDTSSVTLKSKS